jgi:ADP-ribosylglycohydrolase
MKKPYNSYGNGSAMRISPVGFLANSEEDVIDWATKVTKVTHNHPEGIKGAIVTAMCIYYAKVGKDKNFIRNYVEQYYNIDFEYSKLKKEYYFNETCQETVPQAIYCFLISSSYEDCIRTCVSIGGDTDTVCAIAGGIAEAYYKIPLTIKVSIIKYLDERQTNIINKYYDKIESSGE